MDFLPNADQSLMVDACKRMVAERIQPLLDSEPRDRPLSRSTSQAVLKLLSSLGLTAARLPESAGGPGMSSLEYGLMIEQLPIAAAFLLLPQEVTVARLHAGCNASQREQLLPALINADRLICTAATEPDTGSDPRGIRARIKRDGDHYVLNGRKMWISNATISDLYNVTCLDEDGKLVRILVDREQSEVEAIEIPVLGMHQNHLGEVAFNDTRVPLENRLGGNDDAAKVLTLTWLANRPLIGLVAVGMAQQALAATVEYAKGRKQFGKPIGAFQLVQKSLADMELAIVTSRLLCLHALAAIDRGERANGLSAMAKRYSIEASERAIVLAMQLHGSMGLSRELGLETLARDVRMLTIPDGTPEILTLIQGRELTGLDAFRG